MGNGKLKHRQRVAKAPVSGQQKNTIKQPPLVVAIRLRFIDCEDHIRPFPKNMEAEIVYGDNALTETHKIIDDQGLLYFPLPRGNATRYKFFRIKFSPGQNNYVICERAGDEKKTELGGKEKADEKAKDGARFFRLPPHWSFLTSEWAVKLEAKYYDKAEKEKKFLLLEDGKPHGLGTKQEPVLTLLNPHWQYTRFEYFDRYYGHTDHDNKPIGIPAITLEGVFKAKSGDERADTRSNWTVLQDGDQKKSIQCLPWIVQAKPDGSPEPKPDKESIVRFTQPKDTWVVSESATSRKIKSVVRPFREDDEDGKNLVPSANRLKYYDLPELWKSKKYWSRFSDDEKEQGFFESMADKKTTKQKPLLFSLDDIILTEWKDNEATPLSVRSSDRVALFYHEFLDPATGPGQKGTGGRDGAKYLKNGLYKPGPNLADAKAKGLADGKAAEKSKLEKEASEKAITAQKKKEVDEAVEFAEEYAKISGLGYAEIIEEGKEAAAKVETDPAAQERIKKAGETAAAGVASDPAAQAKIENAGKTGEALADAPKQAKLKAEAKQRAVEEKRVSEPAIANQKTVEETEARRLAEEAATAKNLSPREVKAAGNKAVTDLPNNAEAQARIKKAGDDAIAGLATDVAANDRITKEGTAAESSSIAFPYSDVKRHDDVPNYITDYPHWSRILVANGNLFDVFDRRTKTGDVIGARAAVRLVDATVSPNGASPGNALSPRPEFVPKYIRKAGASGDVEVETDQQAVETYFVIQPFFEQKFFVRSKGPEATANRPKGTYDEWGSPLAASDGKIAKNARSDMAVARTSGFDGQNEENAVFRYHRLSFDFTSQESTLNPTAADADAENKRIRWADSFVTNVANRWNGNDGVNSSRAWIIEEKDADPKARLQVVAFVQEVDKPRAHFHISTIQESGTSSMEAVKGTGKLRVAAGADSTKRGFAGAHEMGHAGGQPDDYAPSVKGQTGFGSNHTPGAPFIKDALAMMKANRQVRARSFWHIAEWLREIKPFAGSKFIVKHGANEFKVPFYKNRLLPGRNFVHWPVRASIFHQETDNINYDAYLYFLGKDEYRMNILAGEPDGLIVVVVKTLVQFEGFLKKPAWKNFTDSLFTKLNNKIESGFNQLGQQIYAQFSLPDITRETTNTFEKCLLRVSPRFDFQPKTPAVADPPCHLKITITTPPDAPAAGGASDFEYDDGTYVYGPVDVAGLYSDAKDGTMVWNADVSSPSYGPEKAWNITELQPVLKRWFHAGDNTTAHFAHEMFDLINADTVKEDTQITGDGGASWPQLKNVDEFKAKFTKNALPRTLEFAFPAEPDNESDLDGAVTRLENVFLKHVCEMLGLSSDTSKPNSYQTADSYKPIVKACVHNVAALDPTMSRG